jgi:CelD/BcsL family acetyltransferase involved in cellulose biosynthesis
MSNHRSKTLSGSRRKKRKLEQDGGTLTFVFDDLRPEAMTACMKWKSEQYQRSKLPDLFAHEQHVRLFKELAERGLLLTSSLSAGEHIVAAHIGVFADGRLYWWIPSYDTAYSKYSPGRLLLETLLEESFRQGHAEFDFLIDDASYKWDYATHTRLIAELGSPPLPLRLKRVPQTTKKACKSIVRRSLQPFPRVLNTLKKIRHTMKS